MKFARVHQVLLVLEAMGVEGRELARSKAWRSQLIERLIAVMDTGYVWKLGDAPEPDEIAEGVRIFHNVVVELSVGDLDKAIAWDEQLHLVRALLPRGKWSRT